MVDVTMGLTKQNSRSVLSVLGAMVVVLCEARQIMYMNDAAREVLGDVEGKEWEDVIPASGQMEMWEQLAAAGYAQRPVTFIGPVRCEHCGVEHTVIWNLRKVQLRAGTSVVVTGFSQCISRVPELSSGGTIFDSAVGKSLRDVVQRLVSPLSVVMILSGLLSATLEDEQSKNDAQRLLRVSEQLKVQLAEIERLLGQQE